MIWCCVIAPIRLLYQESVCNCERFSYMMMVVVEEEIDALMI